MRPSRALPPELYWPGARPSQAANWPAVEVVAVADHGQQAGGGGLAHAAQAHELLGAVIGLGDQADVGVVLGDALVEPGHLAEQVADDGVGPAGQVFQVLAGALAHGGGLEGQHDAVLAEQAADAVEVAGALLDKACRARCTISRFCCSTLLSGTKRMCGRCTASQMAAASAASFLPRLPLMRYGVTNLGRSGARCGPGHELPGPVVGAGAGFHADHAGRQGRDQGQQLVARHRRSYQFRTSGLVDAVHGKDVLGEVDSNAYDGHGLPLRSEWMRFATPSWHSLPFAASRLARDGEVPFIR
jgi:hypothetical protein